MFPLYWFWEKNVLSKLTVVPFFLYLVSMSKYLDFYPLPQKWKIHPVKYIKIWIYLEVMNNPSQGLSVW